jgi:arylsulfatase A-like enzyme
MGKLIVKVKHLAHRGKTLDTLGHGNASLKSRLASAFSMSPVTVVRVLTAGLPLAFLYLTLRLLEFSFLADYRRDSAAVVLGRCLPLALLAVLVPAFGYAVVRTQYERISSAWVTAGAVAAGVLFGVGLSFGLPDYFAVTEWFSAEAFTWVRHDLLLIAGTLAGLGILMDRSRTHRVFHRFTQGAFVIAVAFLSLLPVLVVGHMFTMGAPGGWHAIKYFLFFSGDLLPVLAADLTPVTGALLLAPFLIALLPFVVTRLSSVQRWAKRSRGTQPSGGRRVALGVLAGGLLLLAVVPSASLPFHQPESLYASFLGKAAQDLTSNGPAALEDADPDKRVGSVPFQSADMQLTPTDSTQRMNVAFILLESTRRRSTTPYGGPPGVTPFLDSLAQHSLLVEDMFAQISHTNKSMPPLFAGIPPRPTIEITEADPGGIPGKGLPALLKQRGYRTAFFSPVTLGFQDKRQILHNLGFDHLAAKQHIDRHSESDWKKLNAYGYADEAMLDPAARWLDRAATDEAPFFASFLTCVSHHPYATPKSHEQRTFTGSGPGDYLNALHYQDGVLRRLFALFEERGLLDSTLFVVVGDHGEAFGEHGVRTHGNVVWEEGLAVPALLYNPRLFPKGGTIRGNRQHVDLLPTIADVLNYEIKDARLPGRSLLASPPDSTRDIRHITRNPSQGFVLRRVSLKYIYFYGRRPMEVYDVEADPMEKTDIADQFSDGRLQAIKRQMLRWRRSVEQQYANEENS